MSRITVLTIILTLLFACILTSGFNVQLVKTSGTIYIRADGSIDPPTAPITTVDNLTYTLTDNIASSGDGIIVERSDIILYGAEYSLLGSGNGRGLFWSDIDNVTIENVNINGFEDAIFAQMSSYVTICGNRMAGNSRHIIELNSSSNNTAVDNSLIGNSGHCIVLFNSSNNTITGNNIHGNGVGHGVMLYDSSNNNFVSRNNIENTGDGIALHDSSTNNTIIENCIIGSNAWGVWLDCSANMIYHNNFIDSANGHV